MKCLAFFLSLAALTQAADFTTGQAARIVIGQGTFTAADPTSSDLNLGGVSGIAYANGMLFVADSNRVGATPINNRVVLYKQIAKQLPGPLDEIPLNKGVRCALCVGRVDTVLGQTDVYGYGPNLSQSGLRLPTAVATDGTHLVVADTDNNRVLIWNSIPNTNNQAADVVLGQKDFTSNKSAVTASNLRGPQGVWIQGGKLYVADTMNNRILIWNSIPSQNGQAADAVLGQANFTTVIPIDLLKQNLSAAANNMLTPVSVTSDGTRLFVSDLGYNRVLVWNTIPTQNQQPADFALGQPDMVSITADNSTALCASTGVDPNNNNAPVYPPRCSATINFPRFALSDGTRLYIADGGNDRVLVYNTMPTHSGQAADVILGQIDGVSDSVSDTLNSNNDAGANVLRTPLSLAWDGSNLYVSDPYNLRILVFTPSTTNVPINGILNAASGQVFANGSIVFSGTINAGDQITITIAPSSSSSTTTSASPSHDYKYTVVKADTLQTLVTQFVSLINASSGDPYVIALPDAAVDRVILTARAPGPNGNDIGVTSTLSASAQIVVTATNTSGGQDAAQLAAGTLITINGTNLSDVTAAADLSTGSLPTQLGNTEVYVDGRQAPLLYVSPTQINAQIPFEVADSSGVSTYVRTVHSDNTVTATTAVAIPILGGNPGIFTSGGTQEPRPALAYHASSYSTAAVSVDGTIQAGDVATVTVDGTAYTYTVVAADTLLTIRDALVALINKNTSARYTAVPSYAYTRILITAKDAGSAGNGITVAVSVNSKATLVLTALQAATCCFGPGGTQVTSDNPAAPGELILIYAAGLGTVTANPSTAANAAPVTGSAYAGPPNNTPDSTVSAVAGGVNAQVYNAGLKPGMLGVYEVELQLDPSLPTDNLTQLTIAQGFQVSNTVTIPVVKP